MLNNLGIGQRNQGVGTGLDNFTGNINSGLGGLGSGFGGSTGIKEQQPQQPKTLDLPQNRVKTGNIGTGLNTGFYGTTSSLMDRYIDELGSKKQQTKLDFSKGFGGDVSGGQVVDTEHDIEPQTEIQKPKKSLSEFGQAIKTKYPEYADFDDYEIGKAMLEMYPEYGDYIDDVSTMDATNLYSRFKSAILDEENPYQRFKPISSYKGMEEGLGTYLGGMALNLVPSVLGESIDILSSLFTMATHPVKTIKGLGKMVSGAGVNVAIGAGKAITGKEEEEVKEIMYNSPVYNFFKDNIGVDFQENEEIADQIGKYYSTMFGSADGFRKAMKENPAMVISEAISAMTLGTSMLSKAGVVNKAKATKFINEINKANLYVQAPKQTLVGTKSLVKGTSKVLGDFVDFSMNKISGMTKADRSYAKNNPQLVNEFLAGEKNASTVSNQIKSRLDSISDTRKIMGESYEVIKQQGEIASTAKATENMQKLLNNRKIQVDNGKLVFDKFSKFNDKQKSALREAYKVLDDFSNEGFLDADSIMNVRQKLDDLINRKGKPNTLSSVDLDTEGIIKSMRAQVDGVAKQIKGLPELDAKHAKLVEDANAFKKDWFDSQGNLKDNALSKIKNLTNDANKARLERLERVMPGITEDVMGLKVGLAIEGAMESRVGQYAQQFLVSGGILSTFSNPKLALPMIMAGIVITPKNIIKALQTIGKGEKRVEGVVNKIKGNIKLNTKEEALVQKALNNNKKTLDNLGKSLSSEGQYNAAIDSDISKFFGSSGKEPTGLNKIGSNVKHKSLSNIGVESLSYNKSKTPGMVEFDLYKGVGVKDKISTPGAGTKHSFYTNSPTRGEGYVGTSKGGGVVKETFKFKADDVKVLDLEGNTWNNKVDSKGNIIPGYSRQGKDNIIDFHNALAKKEGYKAIVYKGIMDPGGKATKGGLDIADDIVILK